MTVMLYTASGLPFLVDADVADQISVHNWHSRKAPSRAEYYIYRARRASETGPATVILHRMLADAGSGELVDHINGRGWDNRRGNLRIATPRQNLANSAPRRKTFSGLRGVERMAVHPRVSWCASVQIDGKKKRGPHRRNAVQAAFDRDRLAMEVYGEFAVLNFPCLKRGPAS